MKWSTTYRRTGGLALFIAAVVVTLAAIGGAGSSRAASLAKHTGSRTGARQAIANDARATHDSSSGLLHQWAACERRNGARDQAVPTVVHQVIYIPIHLGAQSGWNPGDVTTPACGGYLAAARGAVAGGHPKRGWGNNALYVQYANCMRANGYPSFPYPSGIEPDGNESTNFNGTGIDPNSPALPNGSANQSCGKQIGAPAWWINNWGPPGSVDIYLAGTNPNGPLPGPLPAKRAAALKQYAISPRRPLTLNAPAPAAVAMPAPALP
jgi:hypothetical protein